MRILLAILAICSMPVLLHAADAPNAVGADLKAVVESGGITAAKYKSTPAEWTVENALQSGAIIECSIVNAGTRRRTIITLVMNGKRTQVARIISRDGKWYVIDGNGAEKYRPYEVPLDSPLIYMALQRSEPIFATSRDAMANCNFDGADADMITFRQPLPAAQARQLRATIAQMDQFSSQFGKPLPPESIAQETQLKQLLEKGTVVRIARATGQIVEFGTQQLRTCVTNFGFVPQPDEGDFIVDGRDWKDESDDPTAGNLDNLIMIGHQPGMQAGAKNYELDGRLMDVATGRFRRLPFPGAEVMPGCFLKDRRAVIVGGLDSDSGSVRPYRIDLKTGNCVPIGGELLASGFTMSFDLSPDGTTVCAVHMDPAIGILRFQVCLIKLATGNCRPLGEPLDTAGAHWTADGRHLMLLSRKLVDPKSPSINSLATMDMDGKVTELRKGDSPILLADRQTILYQDADSALWSTCDLQGQNAKIYADGLKGFGFPTPAPDGKRLLMMHFHTGELPQPVVLPIGGSQGTPITHVDGLWGMPAWQ